MQHEITVPGPLLNESGGLAQQGYAKRPLLIYNPEQIAPTGSSLLNRYRLKEWDYYGITTRDWFFSITIANVGYACMSFAYFIDFNTLEMQDATVFQLGNSAVKMPRDSRSGDIEFKHGDIRVTFLQRPEQRYLRVDWPGFTKSGRLTAQWLLHQPADMDSIVMATPMGPKHFYYNEKINCMPAEGFVDYPGGRLEADTSMALANIDWGRGVWPYLTFWNWGSASGFLSDGRRIGLNLGSGFGDLSAATENCFFLDGKMEKLGWVELTYNHDNYHQPWRYVADDGRLDLTFHPFFERPTLANLVAMRTEVHQMFGIYSGTLQTQAGEKITFNNLIGWAEEQQARW